MTNAASVCHHRRKETEQMENGSVCVSFCAFIFVRTNWSFRPSTVKKWKSEDILPKPHVSKGLFEGSDLVLWVRVQVGHAGAMAIRLEAEEFIKPLRVLTSRKMHVCVAVLAERSPTSQL